MENLFIKKHNPAGTKITALDGGASIYIAVEKGATINVNGLYTPIKRQIIRRQRKYNIWYVFIQKNEKDKAVIALGAQQGNLNKQKKTLLHVCLWS